MAVNSDYQQSPSRAISRSSSSRAITRSSAPHITHKILDELISTVQNSDYHQSSSSSRDISQNQLHRLHPQVPRLDYPLPPIPSQNQLHRLHPQVPRLDYPLPPIPSGSDDDYAESDPEYYNMPIYENREHANETSVYAEIVPPTTEQPPIHAQPAQATTCKTYQIVPCANGALAPGNEDVTVPDFTAHKFKCIRIEAGPRHEAIAVLECQFGGARVELKVSALKVCRHKEKGEVPDVRSDAVTDVDGMDHSAKVHVALAVLQQHLNKIRPGRWVNTKTRDFDVAMMEDCLRSTFGFTNSVKKVKFSTKKTGTNKELWAHWDPLLARSWDNLNGYVQVTEMVFIIHSVGYGREILQGKFSPIVFST